MHHRSHHRRPADARSERRRHPTLAARRRSFQLPLDDSLFLADACREAFLATWIRGLDPLLRTWLLESVRRESLARAHDELGLDASETAVDVLVEACAEAQDLTVDELRWLVPTIDEECRAFVRTSMQMGRRNR